MASYTQIGLVEVGADTESNDTRIGDFALGAALDVQYAINPATSLIPVTRMEGVTRAVVAPTPSSGLFAGQAAVIHLSDGPEIISHTQVAMISTMGETGLRQVGNSRITAWAEFREILNNARDYAANQRAYETARVRDMRFELEDIKALVPVVGGQMPLVISADRASDLREIIKFKSEYNVNVIIFGAREGWMVAEELAAADIAVLVDTMVNFPSSFGTMNSTMANAARLHAAGVKIAIRGADISETHNARALPQMAGNAVANGLPWDAALAALTRNPAELFGLSGQYGTLAVGMEADVVVWTGDPFEFTSRAAHVFIRGIEVPTTSRANKLLERYRDLEENDLPFAYRR